MIKNLYHLFYSKLFPKWWNRRIEKKHRKIAFKMDQILCYGDHIDDSHCRGESVHEPIYRGLFETQQDLHQIIETNEAIYHVENNEQENARQDYLDALPNPNLSVYENARQNYITIFNKQKEPLMDWKYPHVCYNKECKQPLQYKHVLAQAYGKYQIYSGYFHTIDNSPSKLLLENAKKGYELRKQLRKWWKSPYVKFLCCNCYAKANPYLISLDHIALSSIDGRVSISFREDLSNEYYKNP